MTQLELLRRVIDIFEELNIPYMIVGSFASGVYGDARLTKDIDVVAMIKYGDASRLTKKFPIPEFYFSSEAVGQAIRTNGQFNIIHPASGNKIDVLMTPDSLWGDMQMQRRQRRRIFPDHEAYVARPEDIILSKMRYYKEGGSEKHMRDISSMLKISPAEIDRDYVETWAKKLDVMDVWEAILRRLNSKQGDLES
ncbi:MAG: hypothetical protein JXA11_06435 [Phycisphaerae bacterium]|nr:hypothetical protein [Phycisphaerae bacterium]